MFNKKQIWFIILLSLVPLLMTLPVLGKLPEMIPTHWNAAGEIDGYMKVWPGAFISPISSIGITFLLLGIPYIDPKKSNYQRFSNAYLVVIGFTILVMIVVQGATLGTALGYDLNVTGLINGVCGVMFVVIGNYMPRFKQNYFAGIRTPWTIENAQVWQNTHRFGGKVFVVAGIIMIFSGLLSEQVMIFGLMTAILLAAISPIAYSYINYRKITKK